MTTTVAAMPEAEATAEVPVYQHRPSSECLVAACRVLAMVCLGIGRSVNCLASMMQTRKENLEQLPWVKFAARRNLVDHGPDSLASWVAVQSYMDFLSKRGHVEV